MTPIKGLIDLITINRKTFFFFVDHYKKHGPFGHGSMMYKTLITWHREKRGMEKLLNDPMFHAFMHGSLVDFGMSRGGNLVRSKDMQASILAHKDMLIELYKHKLYTIKSIGDEGLDVLSLLKKLFFGLKIVNTQRKIVGVSKALHFLLPDLVTPMDGTYTLSSIYGHNKQFKDVSEEFIEFREFIRRTFELTTKLNLTQADADDGRSRSIPKMIDNAIIGGVIYLKGVNSNDDIDEFFSLLKDMYMDK